MSKSPVNLVPYISFEGNCEEALNFYKEVLGGTVEVVNRYDNPNMNAPEDYRDKVLHAQYRIGDILIYAADVFPGKTAKKTSGDVALSLDFPDSDSGKEAFENLAEGGEVGVPFEKQFWGDWHGNLKDQYGIRWMVNCQ